jgi:hypothetical protein
MGHIRAFKPKLCCIINPDVVCHCNYSLCNKHLDHLHEHISARPNINYYYYCHTDFAVVWQDLDSKPVRYRLAYYENKESEEDKGPYKEELGQAKSGNKDRTRQNKVQAIKRKERVGKDSRLLRKGLT